MKNTGCSKIGDTLRKTPIGTEGVANIYLVKCPKCKQLYIDYPHGYTKFLQCPNCKTRIHP